MNLSRFFGSTNREALRQVRLALGPDALIVSNKRVNGGVEILAADPTAEPAQNPHPRAGGNMAAAPGGGVMDAIGDMRGAFEARFDELLWGSQLRRAPQVAQLFQTLLGLGFSTALLRAMLRRIPADLSPAAAMQWARGELTDHLPVLASEDDLWRPGLVLALVGPTGVGKTTTIAKLAARCIRRAGPDQLLLVTTDTYRIGAHEQLKIYGDIMHVPVAVVQDAAELKRAVLAARPDQTILIDNVGISQRDRFVSEQAAMLADAGRPVSRLLVLNASGHGDTLDEVARTYSNDGGGRLRGCIVTKVDEASRIAPSLDVAVRYQLPVCYVSNGQKVPEDLLFLSASELVDQALTHQRHCRDLYAATQADFAVLMSMADPSDSPSPDAAQARRRKDLLPRLLSTFNSGAGRQLSRQDLDDACHQVDVHAACGEAFALWRARAEGAARPDLPAAARHLIRVGVNAQAAGERMVVLHGQTPIGAPASRRGRLGAAVILDGNLDVVASPVQQATFAHGWQSTWDEAAATPVPAGEALLRQAGWLESAVRGPTLVHLVGAGSPSLLRRLSAPGHCWVAQCPARTRVHEDMCATDLGALANANGPGFRLIDVLPGCALEAVFGRPVALWAAVRAVELARRGGQPHSLRAILLRVVDQNTGAVLKTEYGLSNLHPLDAPDSQLAVYLACLLRGKALFSHVAHAWRWLDASGATDAAPMRQALLSAQMGLASWQSGTATELASILEAFGAGRSAATRVPALAKLFTLKQMLE